MNKKVSRLVYAMIHLVRTEQCTLCGRVFLAQCVQKGEKNKQKKKTAIEPLLLQ